MKKIVITLLLFFAIAKAYLPLEIENMIKKRNITHSAISIKITETEGGRKIASYREYERRSPASVIKLMTTYSALLELGKDFRWPTSLFYSGTYKSGVIDGDLIVKAFGDPTLSCRDIPKIVKKLKALGIERITGDIVIDRTFFAAGSKIVSGFDENIHSEYNAMPDALMFDDHLCRMTIIPRNSEIRVEKALPDMSYRVINRLRATDRSCRGRYSWPKVKFYSQNGEPHIEFSGYFSKHCSPKRVAWVIGYPYKSFYYAFRDELGREGIELNGGLRLGALPEDANALTTHFSKPLIEIVSKTNKMSNNLYARHIFLLLGARIFGIPGSEEKGRAAVKKILGTRGIIGSETILDNGCGLSRKTRTSAESIYRLLQNAYRNMGMEWMKSLAIAGRDGTIRRRFRNTIVRGRAWMKTGTLKDAKNIAGYVRGRSGKLYTVVILYNGKAKWKAAALQNDIIQWLVRK
jgi:D-alanyl-D-alanine carboxypeptidase/D-alanyl-D-alanine-endopeptidase (penicillin-binding protein 4)